MRLLVTGATGFIGRALCDRLRAETRQIRAVVRTGQTASLPSGIDRVTIDTVGPDTDWAKTLAGIDTVVHLAARVHIMNEACKDSLKAYRAVNVLGTKHLAQSASAAGIKRFVYLSSIKVNGEETNVSYTENDKPSPGDPYGVSKWEAENQLRQVAAETGLEVVIIRPPLVYGPGVKANFLQLMKIVNLGVPLPLAYTNNRRSFLYVENLVDAIIACIDRHEAAGQTYLVSDNRDVSTAELVHLIANALGRPARLFRFPENLIRAVSNLIGKSAAIDRLLGSLTVDTSKIRGELAWKAPYTLEQGLMKTAEWFKQQ